MEVRRPRYVTARQKQKLIELVTKKHPELISCRTKQGLTIMESQKLWQNIANECNSIHLGAKKSWRRWKKTWQDMHSKRKKRQAEANNELLVSTPRVTNTDREILEHKDIDHPEVQETAEFIPLRESSQEMFNEDWSASLSERDSPVEEKVFNSSSAKHRHLKNPKHSMKHKCYFNCDMIVVQEQRKIQIKEDYLNFKKDYLRQKLKLLKEQTEALKSIAKELSM